jgi:uncharacterized protein
MRHRADTLVLSATDLANFLGCRHRTAFDMAVAEGTRRKPHVQDPLLELLWQRGAEHEKAYVESLRAAGHGVTDLESLKRDPDAAVAATLDAMRAGAPVITQGALAMGRWFGYPDVMRRVERPSALGGWSYEIADTKLARETRAGTILQLGLYSEMLATAQGVGAECFHVVTPDRESPVKTYRVDDYAAYVRLIRTRMESTVAVGRERVAAENYPEPVELCEICPFHSECRDRRRSDDHLSLVAGISRVQRDELESRGVGTLAALAGLPVPIAFKPKRGTREGLANVREQARLQLESRGRTPPLHEFRPFEEESGLSRLPEPSPGDIFLDLEGDPLAVEGGREYLFGVVTVDANGEPQYRAFWGMTEHDERHAFESVMDLIMDAWAAHPGMHVYHYAPYEPSAFKRLMGRHVTREAALDRLLRAERFVDLYAVVRQGVRAGIERYSIKNLEVFYGFTRAVHLLEASRCLRAMELGLELGRPESVAPEVRDAVLGYNRDDCVSTLRLRDWLEALRSELIAAGTPVPRPEAKAGDATEEIGEQARVVEELRARLLAGVPEVAAERNEEQRARWLLAYMLDWHRREAKAEWWEYFRLRGLTIEELLDERKAVAMLEHVERVGFVPHKKTRKPTKTVIDRYRYPVQEMEIDAGDELRLQDGNRFGKVEALDRSARTIDIRKGPSQAASHPAAVFAFSRVDTGVQEGALLAIGDGVAADGALISGPARPDAAARELLLRRPPRLRSGSFVRRDEESVLDFAVRAGVELEDSVLAVQGPPGSGKTFTGARMICALVARGRKVGVTAMSHKAIRNLLDAVVEAGRRAGQPVRVAQKCDEDDVVGADPDVKQIAGNEEALEALQSGEAQVLGGTSWLWARPDLARAVDALFVDEAGQVSLANVLAVSRAARSVVLLGDPQQLEQPVKGSHPEGVGASALEHILGDHKTILEDRGIFLRETWRLAPSICAFTSELFYEGRLDPRAELAGQQLTGIAEFEGSGLWVVDADHEGNRNWAAEEVEIVSTLVDRLTSPGSRWIDSEGREAPLTTSDILVVAPYNAHVTRLSERLAGRGVRVGTVDRFQGQAAPVVIYTMATSRPEDAPRGMEFLYSLNRLNVATSRARCSVIIVASPRLFEPECRTPRQMLLANALCRLREMARSVSGR